MRLKLLFAMLLAQTLVFAQQTWRPMGDDEFNRAAVGSAIELGRHPMVVKNDHLFFFNRQISYYGGSNTRVSAAKFADGSWQHYTYPPIFPQFSPVAEFAVADDETLYLFLGSSPDNGLAQVKKYENGIWVDVGSSISSQASPFVNIVVGSDNFPRILFQEDNAIKLKQFDGTNWNLISQTGEFIPFTSISLALDNNDVPYVVSQNKLGDNYNPSVKKLNGGSWLEIGIAGSSFAAKSLVFDASNTPHMFWGHVIKKFNGTDWIDIGTPLTPPSNKIIIQAHDLFFNQANELFAAVVCAGLMGTGVTTNNLRKCNGNTWEDVFTDGFIANPQTFAVSNNDAYKVTFGTDWYPDVIKNTNGQFEKLGGTSQFITPNYAHSLRVCNGIPMIAYNNEENRAAVRMFTNGTWNLLGNGSNSENQVNTVKIDSGSDGQIYLAYNNKLSSTSGDTKITVKKLTQSGWQPVGPVNFSTMAGVEFDFKIGHNNQPYVFYHSGKLQTYNGSQWTLVGSNAFSGDAYPRFILDANDVPYVAFRDIGNGSHIAVKKLNGNVWEYVDPAAIAGLSGTQAIARLVCDASNNIYLAFTSIPNNQIMIKKLNNGVWEPVGTGIIESCYGDFDLNVDHNNVLHVTYANDAMDFRVNAKVKKFNGTDWELVGIPNFSAHSAVKLQLDFSDNNTPLVSYGTFNSNSKSLQARFFGDENALNITNYQADTSTWTLWPNPAGDIVSIKGLTAFDNIEIYDLTGKKVLVQPGQSGEIDISALQSGMYIAKINSAGTAYSIKLLKN